MSHSWSVRVYKEGDELDISKLMNLRESEQAREQWFWQYKKNPFGHLVVVAEHNEQIVGYMALVPLHLKIDDEILKGSQAVDLYVHPKFRRQGMFLEIGRVLVKEAEKEGITIAYGFPNKPARLGHLKYSWFDVCKIPLLIKLMNTSKSFGFFERNNVIAFLSQYRISRNLLKFLLPKTLMIIGFFSKNFSRIRRSDNLEKIGIRSIQYFDDRIDNFCEEASRDYPIMVYRNKKYLNWRYFEKPNVKYTVLIAEENDKILGYIVLRSKDEKDLKLGYIVDVFVLFEKRDVIQVLIAKAIEFFRMENVDLIVCWMLKNSPSAHIYYKFLRYNGFVYVSSNPLIARVNSSKFSKESFRNPKNWYITIGDSDHI